MMGLLASAILIWITGLEEQPDYCREAWVTGYVRGAGNPRTFDGTPITTGEPIAAAHWSVPLGSLVEVEGVGIFRVADRGRLGPGDIDIAVWSRAEAYQLTGTYTVCVWLPD